MTISANTVWEIRSTATASNANGGGFVTGASGVDYSQQDAAQFNLTGVTSAGAGAIALTASAATTMVGNIVHVVSGTNFTTGWYEIISVVAGVSITCDRNLTTGAGAAGVLNIGGAMSLNSTLDDALLESAEPGNIWYIKNGSYSTGQTVALAKAGTAASSIILEGYNSTRGDLPTGTTRPTIACAANNFTFGAYYKIRNIIFTSTTATGIVLGNRNTITNCKFINLSTTTTRIALSLAAHSQIIGNELVSYRGTALSQGNLACVIFGNYIHDSNIGFSSSATTQYHNISYNLFVGHITAAVQFTGVDVIGASIIGNTIYGTQAKRGIGISLATGCEAFNAMNNIFYGLATGVSHADVQTVGYDNYNDYNNNTADVTNWVKGAQDSTLNPTFGSVSQLTGATATTSGSVLTQSGGDFSAVTDNQDYVYISAGTGITVGYYLITAHTSTTITLDIAPGTNATADKVWEITVGRNFTIGTNLKGLGSPGIFYGADSTVGYMDIGGVQRQELAAGAWTFIG